MRAEDEVVLAIISVTRYCQEQFTRSLDQEFFREYQSLACPERRKTIDKVVDSIIESHIDYILKKVSDTFEDKKETL